MYVCISFLNRSALHYFFTNKRSFQTFGPALQIEIQKILRVACFILQPFGPALFSCSFYDVICVVCVCLLCVVFVGCVCVVVLGG